MKHKHWLMGAGILLCIAFSPSSIKAEAETCIQTGNQNVTVYDNRTGKLQGIGSLEKNKNYTIIKNYSLNFYQIKFGKNFGYIAKQSVKTCNGLNYKDYNRIYAPKNTKIQMIKQTQIQSVATGQKIATAEKGWEFPVLWNDNTYYMVDVAGTLGRIAKKDVKGYEDSKWYPTKTGETSKVPVLMYHHLLLNKDLHYWKNDMTLPVENFQAQMDYLYKNGFQTLTIDEYIRYIKGEIKLKEKTILLTFDDGYKSNIVYAYPKLKQYGMHATMFVISNRNDHAIETFRPNALQFLNKQELKQIQDVYDLGGHTNSLHGKEGNIPLAFTVSKEKLYQDILLNKNLVGAKAFAYPFGQYNATFIDVLKRANYPLAFTTTTGYTKPGDNLYYLKRIGIFPSTSYTNFIQIVNGKAY